MKELFFLKVNILILTIKLDCESVLLEYVTGIKKSEFLFVSQNITTKKYGLTYCIIKNLY